ncbi:MAG: chloride channel protein [Alphaproteobacteria bacterium]
MENPSQPDTPETFAQKARPLLVLVAGAVVAGIVVGVFSLLSDKAQDISALFFSQYVLAPLLVTPAIFALAMWLMLRYCPAAFGSGVPQTMAAQQLVDKDHRRYLLGAHVVIGKVLLVTLVLLGGASLGREGPAVQIAAGIMLLFASGLHERHQQIAIAGGAAAGVAAAFNAPIAALAFLMEEMTRGTAIRDRLPMMAVVLITAAAAMLVTGQYNYFGTVKTDLALLAHIPALAGIGVICGLLGGLFNILVTRGKKYLLGLRGGFCRRRPVLFAALCGLIVAVIGIASGGMSFGSGHIIGQQLLQGEVAPQIWHPFAKMAATLVSIIGGIPGGTIAPSLSIGATVGGALSAFLTDIPAETVILLAIAGYFAAFTQAPLTAAIIALEVTGYGSGFLPLLAVALVSAGISRLIFPFSIFHLLAADIAAEMKNKHKPEE